MSVKHYSQKTFTFVVNGQACSIYCSTTNTRNGFCHHAYFCGLGRNFEHTRVSYINRTWERYDYETVMRAAVRKLAKDMQPPLMLELDNIGRREAERCERLFAAFQANFAALSDEQKQFVREHTPELTNMDQARAVTGGLAMLAACNG